MENENRGSKWLDVFLVENGTDGVTVGIATTFQ